MTEPKDMNDERDARIDKVQKLLNKAQGASTEEEASAFFAKAEELMTKWAIDDAMLRASGKLEKEEIETRRVKIASTYFNVDIQLLHGITRVQDCRLLQNKQGRYAIVIGFPSDIDNVLTMYNLLQIQSARFARESFKTEGIAGTPMDEYVWRRSFRGGFASRISERLREQKVKSTTAAGKQHGSGMELVLVDKKAQVDDFYRQMGSSPARSSRSRHDVHGEMSGRKAGDRADVGNKRVSNRKQLGS